MRTELIIEGNAVYEVDFDCMEKKNLPGAEGHCNQEETAENAEKRKNEGGYGQTPGQKKTIWR